MAFEDNPKVQELLGILQSLGIGAEGLDTHVGVMDTGKTLNPLFTDNPNYYEGTGMKDLRYFPKYLESDNEFSHQVGEGYNQHFDEWSPSDGIPGEGNPHIGEPTSNLGLPDTASYQSGYSTGSGVNPNWGSGRYNYKKNIYDVQTINMMINQGAINPKLDQIIPRLDIGEDAYEVKLASADNTLWNDQLQMFMGQDYLRSPSMGGEAFKDNIMGGSKQWDSLRPKPYRDTPARLDFNTYS